MADVQSNIHVNIDTSDALASLKLLQRQISAFHTQMSKSGAAASAIAANQAQNLMNSINATGKFQASMRTVATSTEYFTNALEKNKLTSREYFRYTGAATKSFGRLFKSEFETINKVARERVKDIQTQYIKMGRGANGALQAIAVRPLTLDMKNLGTQTAIAAQRQQLLNQLLKQGSTNLLNFGKNTQWAGRQLMVGFTVPLMLLGSTAAKTFMKLEEQAIRFKRVYGEMFTTQEETDAMVKQIQTLAKEYTKYGVAVEKTMEMAANAAAMGKMGAELTAQVTEATRLAVLGGVEQEQALETTISVTNAFGVAAEDLAKKIDFLNAVENQTVVSIEDLTIAIPKAGPVVQQLGGDVEDLAFFLTAMKEGGINASEGANALKSGLASLINPSDKASKMLAGLGINIKGIVEANKGDVAATVVGFSQALDTLDPLNRARAIEQLFGKFQFSRLSTLFKNVTAEGSQAARVLGLTRATTEELAILSQRELDKIENTTTYKFKKSLEDLKVTLAPVGEQFLKALTPIVEFASKVLEKFNNLGDGSKKFLTIVTVALGAIGPIALMTFGLLANGLANIIKLFATMKSSFNRAGSSTQILGNQTDYLTQQQLEASAVAASLDQVHQKLRQTFTSETAAVNALAAAYKKAIASQLGFTGPVGKGRMPQSKKYSTGVTSVPGTGNKDTVPAMLTPGEAVIPAQAAQDPANRPVIARMVAGETVQQFGTGSENVQKSGRKKAETAFAHASGPTKYRISDVPAEFRQQAAALADRGIPKAIAYSGIGFDIPPQMNLDLNKKKSKIVDVRAYEAEIKKPGSITTMTARLMDPPNNLSASEAVRVSKSIRSNLLASLKDLPDGTKINDKTIYSRMGNAKKGILGGLARDPKLAPIIQKMLSPHALGAAEKTTIKYDSRPATPRELYDAVKNSKSNPAILPALKRLVDHHPNIQVEVQRNAKDDIIGYNRPEVSRTPPYKLKTQMSNANLNEKGEFKPGRSGGDTGAVKVTTSAASRRIARKHITTTPDQITTYGKRLEKGAGYSNPIARHVAGVYETTDGRKVFVKPMIDLDNALAEQRATVIARDVHGLEAPKQELRLIKDPVTKRVMYALESPYDPKFSAGQMPKDFTRDDYFRQLLASSLRGDKDLGKGNLGGNRLTDVGTAGIYDVASQYSAKTGKARVVSDQIKSVAEQARINLGGVPGSGAKSFFYEATKNIPLGMTADEYHKAMIAEIDRVLPKLESTVKNFNLDPTEAKPYNEMIKRLQAARKVDWRELWNVHRTGGKVAIKPTEMIEDKKTKKLRKPKTQPIPAGVKSSGGKADKVMTDVPAKGEQVVQGPGRTPSKRMGRFIMPGKADAPLSSQETKDRINKEFSQSKAAASRTALYGSGPIDAEQKALRRQLQKLQKSGKQLNVIAKDVAVSQKVVTDNMTENAKKQSLSSRLLESYKTRRAANVDPNGAPKGRMGLGGAAMIASGVAMLGSMAPGKTGEIAQKIMMPLMGLSMVLPMLNNRAGAVGIGLAATVGAFVALRIAFNSAQDKVLEEAEKFRGSSSAIQNIAKFGGKVTASEQMDLRRKNSFSMLGPATGKTTYGEAFAQTKEGKALSENIAKQNAAGRGSQAVSDLTSQLSTAVMSGAMDINQAKSLAMNVAKEAGDMSIGIKVIAQMEKVLGPNGEDLAKNPLQVRIRMINENKNRMKSNISNIQNVNPITKLAGQKTMQKVGIGASALGGAAAGAGIGTFIGGPIGAAIGGGIGAAIGAGLGYFSSKKYTKQAAELGAAYAVDAKIAMEQNKEMLDSFDLYYQKKIEELRLQGKINEANDLQNQYIEKRDKLTSAQATLQANIVSQYNSAGGMQEAMMSGMKKAAKARYKDNPNEIAYMDVVGAQAGQLRKDGAIDKGQEFLIQAKMASGDIPPSVFRQLLQMATDNKDIAPKMMNIITKFSGATSESIGVAAQNILTAKGDIDKTVQAKFITKVSAFEEDSDALDFAKNMIKLNNLNAVIPSNFLVKYYTENDAAYQQLNTMLDAIEGEKNLTADIVYNIIPNIKGTGAFDENYFNTLTEDQQKVYTTTIASIINVPDPKVIASQDYKDWLMEKTTIQGRNYGGGWYPQPGTSQAAMLAYYREQQGFKAVTEGASITANAPTTGGDKGSGNKPKASPLDDLLKRLRDVRKNQIKVTEGFDASFKSLNKLFGGKKTIEIFSGIENDMRRLGAGEDLIELIVGMDPKEYEKQKGKLFEFDKNGNIKKIKDGAKSIGDALQSVKLGEFVSEQQKMANQIGNQTTALKRLQAAGVEGSVALEAVSDATFAAAIANKKLSDEQIQKIVKAWNKATKASKAYAANEAAINKTKDFTDRAKLLTAITSKVGEITVKSGAAQSDVIDALLNNPELANMLITPGIDQEAFEKLLQAALDSARTELKIKQLSIEGMQDIFDTGYGNAMEAFDVEETRLRLNFDQSNKKIKDEIKKAEELIAAKQEQIRIQEVGLKEIEDQEEKVNEKYDERLKALDEVEKANAAISQQQKGQLTLAEALTSGDIAAAARAAQEMRAQSAAEAVTKQKDALENAREFELGQLRSKDGRSRIEIEKEIKRLQDEIYLIEQKSLEPNRETLRKSNRGNHCTWQD
jgi:TP901 family phage tail tape measure protein